MKNSQKCARGGQHKEVIIFGTGWSSEKFWIQHCKKIEVAGFFDNYPKIEKFHGKKVQKPVYKKMFSLLLPAYIFRILEKCY